MYRRVFTVWVVVACVASPVSSGAEPSGLKPDARFGTDEKFEKHTAEVAASDDLVGLALAVVRKGKITLLRTYGPRELGKSEPIDPHTVFRTASLSKGFATSLVAQLVTEGKLKLAARANAYSSDFRLKDRSELQKVNLEFLMSHRLGLPPNAYDNLLEANIPPAKILRRLGEVKPICRVGQCYGYQNVAFNVITDAIEAADGRKIDEAMTARLFKPLDMKTASMGLKGLRSTGNWARSHRRRRGKPWRLTKVKEAYYRVPAAAGVNASITDMAHWLATQMGNAPAVLSPEMLAMLHKPRVETPVQIRKLKKFMTLEAAHYGLGWRVYEYRGETVVGHTGSVDGYSAKIAFLPDRKAGLVILTNSRSRAFFEITPVWLDLELSTHSSSDLVMGESDNSSHNLGAKK